MFSKNILYTVYRPTVPSKLYHRMHFSVGGYWNKSLHFNRYNNATVRTREVPLVHASRDAITLSRYTLSLHAISGLKLRDKWEINFVDASRSLTGLLVNEVTNTVNLLYIFTSSSECSAQRQVLHCKRRNLGCSSAEGRSSTANSGTKATVC